MVLQFAVFHVLAAQSVMAAWRAALLLFFAVSVTSDRAPSVTAWCWDDASKVVLVRFIAWREGFWRPGTLPRRMHNPCDLSFAGQPAAVRGSRAADGEHLAKFPTAGQGWRACEADVAAKQARGVDPRVVWHFTRREKMTLHAWSKK